MPTDVFNRELRFADLVANTDYTVVTNPAGVTRDGENRLVLTANDTVGPTTVISLAPLLRLPFFHITEVWVGMSLASSAQDYAGGTNTHLNTRFGIRHYAKFYTPTDASPRHCEAHVGKSTATNWTTSAARWDSALRTRGNAAGQSNLSLLKMLQFGLYHLSTQVYPSQVAHSSAGWGAGVNGGKGTSIGIPSLGVDWTAETESGELELYVDLGVNPAGKDLAVTLDYLLVRDYVCKLHP